MNSMANSQIDIKRLSFPNADAQLLLGLKGDKGDTGDKGDKGDTGDTGNGIASITHTGTSGAVKTYTITFTDGTSQTYDVTDGQVTTEQMNTAIDNAVTDVKSDIDKIFIKSMNLYNPATDRHGKAVSVTGEISDNSTYKLSDYIYVGAGNSVVIPAAGTSTTTGGTTIAIYSDANESSFIRRTYLTSDPFVLTLSGSEAYIVLSMYEVSAPFMVNMGQTLLPYTEYGSITVGDVLTDILAPVNAKIDGIQSEFQVINLFDKSNITAGSYINPTNGTVASGAGFFASDYIDVSSFETIKVSKTHILALYNADKTFLSAPSNMNSINSDLSIDVSEASYIRFSSYNQYLDSAQIGESISSSKYVPYGRYTLPNFVIEDRKIVVDASGNGDYTSFTKAVYDNVDSGVDIIVKAGTYDIVSEYVALFGQTAVDNMADADASTFHGFQYGLVLRNRKIEFASGAHLVCDWTGHTVDGTHRFSALAVCYNVEIVGLDLVSTHTFYAIHDDYGNNNPYTVKYENCKVKGINLTNANCIGGGCKPYSRHIINNCYFDNGIGDAVVRYHNTNAVDAEPELYISNSYFNSILSFNYYGSQTTKMKAYVNNCKATAIRKAQESSSFSVDNVELYKWCCEETA
jgi:hypothetical protein